MHFPFFKLRPHSVVLLGFPLVLLLFRETTSNLLKVWTDTEFGTYTHGLVILAISIIIFAIEWKKLPRSIPIKLDTFGLVLLIIASLAWMLAHLAYIQVIQEVSLVFLPAFLIWALLGYRVFVRLLFPFVLMMTAIPVWDLINLGQMQWIAAAGSEFLMNVTGIPTFRDGFFLFIPNGVFEVEGGCSGIKQLIIAIAIALLYGYMHRLKPLSIFVVVALAAGLSIISNVIRIYIVVYSGYLTDMQHYFVTQDHTMLGWGLFAVAIFIFIGSANFLIRRFGAFLTNRNGQQNAQTDNMRPDHVIKKLAVISIAFIGFSIGPAIAYTRTDISGAPVTSVQAIEIPGWSRTAPDERWSPVHQHGDVTIRALFHNDENMPLDFYAEYFLSQKQGREAINFLNKVYDGDQWLLIQERSTRHTYLDENIIVEESLLKTLNGDQRLVWRWYYINGVITGNRELAKLYNLWGMLRNHPSIAVIITSAEISGFEGEANARQRLAAFFDDGVGAITDAFSAAPDVFR